MSTTSSVSPSCCCSALFCLAWTGPASRASPATTTTTTSILVASLAGTAV